MSIIGSELEKDRTYAKNVESFHSLQKGLNKIADVVRLGGGNEAIEKHRKRGKLFVRDRIEKLIDPGSRFLEIGLYAAHGMYKEYGGAPSSGTVLGVGKIHNRDVVIVANDATVKAGAWFPMTRKEKSPRTGDLDGKPPANRLPRGFRRCFPPPPIRNLS